MTRLFRFLLLILAGLFLAWTAALFSLRYLNPPTTGVQVQRRAEAFFTRAPYLKRYTFVPLRLISPDLQHAVVSAEDGSFYRHHGIDWEEMEKVAQESADSGEAPRGASTLTQQLVKNLFFTTHRNPFRKLLEYPLAMLADRILGKKRVLELYLNVVEWGPAVYGAEAAAQYHYSTQALRLDREQAARLAACLPAPRRRRPAMMSRYSTQILERMQRAGW